MIDDSAAAAHRACRPIRQRAREREPRTPSIVADLIAQIGEAALGAPDQLLLLGGGFLLAPAQLALRGGQEFRVGRAPSRQLDRPARTRRSPASLVAGPPGHRDLIAQPAQGCLQLLDQALHSGQAPAAVTTGGDGVAGWLADCGVGALAAGCRTSGVGAPPSGLAFGGVCTKLPPGSVAASCCGVPPSSAILIRQRVSG